MSATLLTIRNRVKVLLNNDDFFTDANIDVHINASYEFHHAIVSDALQNRLVIEDFIDTEAGTVRYNLNLVKTSGRIPDQVVNLKYFASDISSVNYIDLQYETRSKIDDITSRGIPQTYEIIGDDIVLGLPPNKALTNGLKVLFVPYPNELTDDTDATEQTFQGMGDQCIVYYTVLMCKAQEETWDAGSTAIIGFKRTYEDLVLRFKNNLEMRAFEEDEVESFLNDDVNY